MRQLQLIQLYYYICHCYDTHLSLHFQRQSNNYKPVFTDQEVLTIYIFGIFQKRFTVKDTYDYIVDHWQDWFPALPSYQAYNHRLNQLGWQFQVIVNALISALTWQDGYATIYLTDSMPIILSKRPYQAKVALPLADKGYCAAKNLYYHGLKFHFLGLDVYQTMPMAKYVGFTAASANDLTALKSILSHMSQCTIIADKAYACQALTKSLDRQAIEIITPVKLKKGHSYLEAADKVLSSYISSMRQPVESFFNWLIEKTAIQTASKVRSEKGLQVHCYGRLAAALFLLVFNS